MKIEILTDCGFHPLSNENLTDAQRDKLILREANLLSDFEFREKETTQKVKGAKI